MIIPSVNLIAAQVLLKTEVLHSSITLSCLHLTYVGRLVSGRKLQCRKAEDTLEVLTSINTYIVQQRAPASYFCKCKMFTWVHKVVTVLISILINYLIHFVCAHKQFQFLIIWYIIESNRQGSFCCIMRIFTCDTFTGADSLLLHKYSVLCQRSFFMSRSWVQWWTCTCTCTRTTQYTALPLISNCFQWSGDRHVKQQCAVTGREKQTAIK